MLNTLISKGPYMYHLEKRVRPGGVGRGGYIWIYDQNALHACIILKALFKKKM